MATPAPSWRKAIFFRVAAVLVGLSPLLLLELACHIFDWGRPSHHDDPFVGFSDIHPLFVLNAESGRYEIAPSRLTHFRPDAFTAAKPANGFRIFVLGESTVQGRPYAIETAFPTWLKLGLESADPARSWEVVNCGGISYASYRLTPIMQELLAYQPDLFILCVGHNEFLEDRTYEHIKRGPWYLSWPSRQAARLRTYTLLRAGIRKLRGDSPEAADRPLLGPETDARLDWRGGMELYQRDEAWRQDVIAHYEYNLRRMVARAQEAGVPLLLVAPVSNLEWPPFKSEHRAGLTEAERQRFDDLWDQARARYEKSLPQALELLLAARRIDDQHAALLYDIGKCYQELGRWEEARQFFIAAKDQDICPLRMLEPMKETLERVARETGTPLVDAGALFAGHSRGGISGSQWLADHVHPTIEGHQHWSDWLLEELARQGIVADPAESSLARRQAYQRHLASLDAMYFVQGQRRLESEQRWARGKATWERRKIGQ